MTTITCFPVLHTEVDGMGIVHHSNYTLWFEKARRDYLKKAGISSSQIVSQGFFLPLSEMECKYRSPAKAGDEIMVLTKILSMSYGLHRELIIEGNVYGKGRIVGQRHDSRCI
jgi:Predicted thioesterase